MEEYQTNYQGNNQGQPNPYGQQQPYGQQTPYGQPSFDPYAMPGQLLHAPTLDKKSFLNHPSVTKLKKIAILNTIYTIIYLKTFGGWLILVIGISAVSATFAFQKAWNEYQTTGALPVGKK